LAVDGVNERNRPLTSKQELAIDYLVTGMSQSDVARRIDISREQLWRWRTQNPAFASHQAQRRSEFHETLVDGLWGLAATAMGVAGESLAEGDPRMAIDILRLVARGLTDIHYEDAATRMPRREGFRCSVCDLVAKSKRGLEQHRRRKHATKVEAHPSEHQTAAFVCSDCGRRTKSKRGLNHHRRAKHPPEGGGGSDA
jgi:hypothetical protein